VPTPAGDVVARPGDYVCRQEIVIDRASPPDVRIEVWAREMFEKIFLPVQQTAMQAAVSPPSPAAAQEKKITSSQRSKPVKPAAKRTSSA
jgi:hypothetical protein